MKIKNTAQLRYLLALMHAHISIKKKHQLWARFPNLNELFQTKTADLLGLPPAFFQPDWSIIDQALQWLEKNPNHYIITYHDTTYPSLLKEIPDPPLLLFIKGHREILSSPQLAMVGSRHPTPLGIENARQFAAFLVKAGYAITSGLALGIDAASHRGALEAQGKTIAVLGTGIDQIYPYQHKDLAEIIIEQGALVSEFPLHTRPLRENFPQRNRLISGLSVGTLVVEANIQSGSLITAHRAVEQGREVFAIPGSIHNPVAHGCHALIKEGAKLVETAKDILEELGAISSITQMSAPFETSGSHNGLDQNQQKLLEYIGFDAAVTADKLAEQSGLSANTIGSLLSLLELQGFIKIVPGGYSRAKL